MKADWNSLGGMMTDSIRHLLENRPKELIALLKREELTSTVLKRAKSAMEQLYMTAETEADRDMLWSDLKWQTGLFPPEEPKTSETTQAEARKWLNMMGGTPKLVDMALKEANLGYNWDPENPEAWTEE